MVEISTGSEISTGPKKFVWERIPFWSNFALWPDPVSSKAMTLVIKTKVFIWDPKCTPSVSGNFGQILKICLFDKNCSEIMTRWDMKLVEGALESWDPHLSNAQKNLKIFVSGRIPADSDYNRIMAGFRPGWLRFVSESSDRPKRVSSCDIMPIFGF